MVKNQENSRQKHLQTCFSQPSTDDPITKFTPSAALIVSNDDLLTEILLRLPITPILRFKSVSKHWQSLLTQPPFTLLYDNLSISTGLFIRNLYIPFDPENQSTPPFRSLNFYPDLCGIRIVQSCNGLLLCCSDRGNKRSRKYYVFNPTTKQFAVIPLVPGGQEARKTIRFMGLTFHRTGGVHYEIVCIRRYRATINEGLFHIQIYSSTTNKWQISDNYFHASYYTIFRNVTYPEMIQSYQSPTSPHYYDFEIIDLVRGNQEGEEDVFMVVKIPEKIIRCNVLDMSFKEMFDLSEIYIGRIGYSEVHRYIPSLTSF